uniref:Uncharacterized protein n=1 Tax=Strigamia maritima TaxID=126957 RepID=T1JFF4_STRMM
MSLTLKRRNHCLLVGRLVSSWAETVKRRCDASSQVGADEDFVPRPSDRILVSSCLRSSQTKGSSSSAVTSDGSFKVPSNKLVKPTKSSTSSAKITDAEPNSKDDRKTKGNSGGPNGSPPADPNISNQPAKRLKTTTKTKRKSGSGRESEGESMDVNSDDDGVKGSHPRVTLP